MSLPVLYIVTYNQWKSFVKLISHCLHFKKEQSEELIQNSESLYQTWMKASLTCFLDILFSFSYQNKTKKKTKTNKHNKKQTHEQTIKNLLWITCSQKYHMTKHYMTVLCDISTCVLVLLKLTINEVMNFHIFLLCSYSYMWKDSHSYRHECTQTCMCTHLHIHTPCHFFFLIHIPIHQQMVPCHSLSLSFSLFLYV